MLYVEGFDKTGCITDEEVFEIVRDNKNLLRGSNGNSELDVAYRPRWLRGTLASVHRVGPRSDRYWLMEIFRHDKESAEQREGIIHSIGHELGHIFWADHMPRVLKERWLDIWLPFLWSELRDEAREGGFEWRLSRSSRREMIEAFCDSVADVILLPESQWSLWHHQVNEIREKVGGGKIG